MRFSTLLLLLLFSFARSSRRSKNRENEAYFKHKTLASVGNIETLEGKLVKGNKNAIFLVRGKKRFAFPDFYTFSSMGYNVTDILKIPDHVLDSLSVGPPLKSIPSPPTFRAEDYFYHEYCDDPDRMISDIGVLPNLGDYMRAVPVLERVSRTKRFDIVALGGSITAGGYFEDFVRQLRTNDDYRLNVSVHNHGHGATEITYTIFCVDIERYNPDLVLIDFSVNDYGHPKLMEALIRKVLQLKSKPLVVLVNLWVHNKCPITRYLLHAFYYRLPVINICPAVNLCFGRKRLPQWKSDEYSKTDGVHPWGPKGVSFIGKILFAWWERYKDVDINSEYNTFNPNSQHRSLLETTKNTPPELLSPLYSSNPIGKCTRCDALVDDADAILTPVDPPKGFKVVTRVKVGYGGFNPIDKNSSTKSFKKSWQANTAGSHISFKFYGSSVKIAMWQRRDGMGILNAYIDGDSKRVAKASGFFKGFTWAMEKNNTGRSEIIPLFEGLEDKEHTLKLVVSDEPANIWVKGHMVQIFALLSASDSENCKDMIKKI